MLASLGGLPVDGAEFVFYGRSGDAIELDFGSLPGTPAGATYGELSLAPSFGGHTALTSDRLDQGDFATTGRLWVFPNPLRDFPRSGDTDLATRGFQGTLEGTIEINGQPRPFAVNVVAGHTGAGTGSVQQSLERVNRPANNPLYVAQQQQRLRYLGFRSGSGGLPAVDGDFGASTDEALRTFQAAFLSGSNVNITQSSVDGIIGPNTVGWLNAANAPTWDELIDPDPQAPGTFSVSRMIGDFDILPSRDPGGARTGNTPQIERFGASWAIDLFEAGAKLAKSRTGITQLMNGMSTLDGYDSAAFHNTHRAGMDIDIHVDASTWVPGNGFVSAAEQAVIDHAIAFIDAGNAGGSDLGRIARYITSNTDIRNGIQAARPGTSIYLDAGGGHFNHLHIDVAPPPQQAGLANVAGDFNLDDRVDAADYTVWRDRLGVMYDQADYNAWVANFGARRTADRSLGQSVPEPAAIALGLLAATAIMPRRR